MLEVRIRTMRVIMALRFMLVQVAVWPFWQRIVRVVAMATAVIVRMFVIQSRVFMRMAALSKSAGKKQQMRWTLCGAKLSRRFHGDHDLSWAGI